MRKTLFNLLSAILYCGVSASLCFGFSYMVHVPSSFFIIMIWPIIVGYASYFYAQKIYITLKSGDFYFRKELNKILDNKATMVYFTMLLIPLCFYIRVVAYDIDNVTREYDAFGYHSNQSIFALFSDFIPDHLQADDQVKKKYAYPLLLITCISLVGGLSLFKMCQTLHIAHVRFCTNDPQSRSNQNKVIAFFMILMCIYGCYRYGSSILNAESFASLLSKQKLHIQFSNFLTFIILTSFILPLSICIYKRSERLRMKW